MHILSATIQIEGRVLELTGDRGTLVVNASGDRRTFAFNDVKPGQPRFTRADRALNVLRVLGLEHLACSAVDLDDLGLLIDEVRQ